MEWISVKDELPSLKSNSNGLSSDYVLAYIPSYDRLTWTKEVQFICYYTDDGWYYYYGDRFYKNDAEAISHWMPLPEPPKS